MARIGLSHLPRRVQAHLKEFYGLTVDAPTYRRCFDAAIENRIPAEFIGGRWTVEDALPALDAAVRGLRLLPGTTPVPTACLASAVREPVAA